MPAGWAGWPVTARNRFGLAVTCTLALAQFSAANDNGTSIRIVVLTSPGCQYCTASYAANISDDDAMSEPQHSQDFWQSLVCAASLAVKDANARDGSLVPELSGIPRGMSIELAHAELAGNDYYKDYYSVTRNVALQQAEGIVGPVYSEQVGRTTGTQA